ncbi:MAG: helix-turn-helix domain-containing protein [Bacteroidota bacterium]
MDQFTLLKNKSNELESFPYIEEFALFKITTINLDSFLVSSTNHIRIYCVVDGKFEWVINNQTYILYPGDIAIILPEQEIGGSKGFFDIGTLFMLAIHVDKNISGSGKIIGNWSKISPHEKFAIEKMLLLNKSPALNVKTTADKLFEIRSEIMNQEMGYQTRVTYLIDSLLIAIARQSTRQANSQRDFPGKFMDLEKTLRQNLAHQWTVEEMAALFGLGTTAFTEKVKSFTGFSPLNYLITIRISEAIKLLKRTDVYFTKIALDTGFYSSQHFSTTFKKLTGYTPSEFRKRNAPQ